MSLIDLLFLAALHNNKQFTMASLQSFRAAIGGLTSIQAYGAEESFKTESLKRTDKYTRPPGLGSAPAERASGKTHPALGACSPVMILASPYDGPHTQ